ncbi:MAG: aspartate aminotransferase family protein [Gammaproteobacteria bacterium]|nr:aspartate aminotransferase family protein [Gammaproteobacteria bacterium]
MSDHLMQNYTRLPVAFTKGEGPWLWDGAGKKYLDAIGGIAVCGLGHAHPQLAQALYEQASTLIHTSNVYQINLQEQLADRLCALASMDRAFFCNSGAEANEAAIKLARLYGHQQGITLPHIIVMEGSFHGRTLATLTATGNRKIQAGFEPLVQGFLRVPYDDVSSVEHIAKTHKEVVAILVEPITGEGGVRLPAPDYLNQLRRICDEKGWLLMLDEIQTGMGRTGHWFAHHHNGIVPDVMTLAKALGNGVPIGACLARGKAAQVFKPGTHGSTFGGNLLACRAALTVVDIIEQQHLVERAKFLGTRMLNGLQALLDNCAGVKTVRGQGLMLGIEVDRPCKPLVEHCLEAGVLVNVTADNVVRLLPPLILSDQEADTIVRTVSDQIRCFLHR